MMLFMKEKTATFWIGFVALSYSIYQFCLAGWEVIYLYFIYQYPTVIVLSQLIPVLIPHIIGGVIFLVVGLYIMIVATRKNQPIAES